QRIFMFLDLRSSTRIAERLGEERYFNFLKEVYRLVTPSILNNQGEIYQYVGDEIVISWRTKKPIMNDSCVNCFFDIKKVLNQKAKYFKENFGEVPIFKAGLHYGYVMAGEIGVVKRDIVYSGDVLNTTARIQAKCNEFGVDILISKFLLDRLNLKGVSYHPKEIGDIELRGREEHVVLFTL
ncbi:MAG: adenylate/guanylate cyclase domain-containing protein, partial [Bacteroidota bacterium]